VGIAGVELAGGVWVPSSCSDSCDSGDGGGSMGEGEVDVGVASAVNVWWIVL
jgi:hypothetical protein